VPIKLRCLHNDVLVSDQRFSLVKQATWHRLDLRPDLEAPWNTAAGAVRSSFTPVTLTNSANGRFSACADNYSGAVAVGNPGARATGSSTAPSTAQTTIDSNDFIVAGFGAASTATVEARPATCARTWRGRAATAEPPFMDNTAASPGSLTNTASLTSTLTWSASSLEKRLRLLAIVGLMFTVFALAQSKTGDVAKMGGGAGGPSGPACTLFASTTGLDSNSGLDAQHPKTFQGGANSTVPGSVLCLLGGTYNLSSSFNPPHNGKPGNYIVYRNNPGDVVNFVWTGGSDASAMIRLGAVGTAFPMGPSYLEFRGLNFDGSGNAGDAFYCRGGHHLRFIGNSMSNTGGSGVGSRGCDYLTADHNIVNHNGYMPASTSVPQYYGWTSGISYNSDQWFDNYPGFHNVIANNIVVGEYDSSTNHTDGNGIILDLSNGSYTPSTANTPPVLIINNVVYGNGGRCIQVFIVTNYYVINNSCYKNNLDTSLKISASLVTQSSNTGWWVNNIGLSYNTNYPTYGVSGSLISKNNYRNNLYYGAPLSNITPGPSDAWQNADPLFVNPPVLAVGGYSSALSPLLLGNGLRLQTGSPARGYGIDATAIAGLDPNIVNDMSRYFFTDINGVARAHRGPCDLGAYQQ